MDNYWQCRDCRQLYDIDVDKCIECGTDDWVHLTKSKYIELMQKKLDKLRGNVVKVKVTKPLLDTSDSSELKKRLLLLISENWDEITSKESRDKK